jgi:hypothetical protein
MSYITVGRESIKDVTELLERWEIIGERGLGVDSQELLGVFDSITVSGYYPID